MSDRIQFEPNGGALIEREDGERVIGIVRPVEDGVPMAEGAELIESDGDTCGEWHTIRTLYKHSGPAQVATKEYREGYDRIFGAKRKVGLA